MGVNQHRGACATWRQDSISNLDILAPFFVAITGKRSATPLFDTIAILGKDITCVRIRDAIDTLKPLSGKEQKKWDVYRDLMSTLLSKDG